MAVSEEIDDKKKNKKKKLLRLESEILEKRIKEIERERLKISRLRQ